MSNMLSEQQISTRAESTVVTLSSNSQPTFEDSTVTRANSSGQPKGNFCRLSTKNAWRVIKCLIFVACATFFTYQTSVFYKYYHTYPTTTNIVVVRPEYYKMPAVTFCNRNLINRTDFCGQYPHLCSQPNNLKEFCKEHPYMCKGNVSNLVIPMVGYYTNTSKETTAQIKETLQELVRTTNETGFISYFEGWEEIYSPDLHGMIFYPRCYSYFLHLFNKDNQTTRYIYSRYLNLVSVKISQKKEEYIFPWYDSQVSLMVHSPFEPEKPMQLGRKLKSGFDYEINIRLEEEHLLPAPYATNCTDYEALWFQNNKTGPRSSFMCREVCWLKYTMKEYGCEFSANMFVQWDIVCKEVNRSFYYFDFYIGCIKKCKTECLKLKYTYTVTETPIVPLHRNNFKVDRDYITLSFYVRDTDVTVISHVPLYGDWELFSYVGGLVGCWLGISVWALVGIGEKTLRKFVKYIKTLKKKRKQTAAVSTDSKEHSF